MWGVRSRGNLVHGGEEEEEEKEAKCREDVRDGLSRCGGECWVTLANRDPCVRNWYL